MMDDAKNYNRFVHILTPRFVFAVTEYEYNVFGETGAEVCSELAVLCPAVGRAVCHILLHYCIFSYSSSVIFGFIF